MSRTNPTKMNPSQMNLARLGLVALASVILSACQTTPEPARPDALDSNTWVLISLGGSGFQMRSNATPTLSFRGDGTVSGYDGCNRMSGGYSTDGGSLSFGALAVTRMACPGDGALQAAYAAALGATASYTLQAGVLILRDEDGGELVRFGPQGG